MILYLQFGKLGVGFNIMLNAKYSIISDLVIHHVPPQIIFSVTCKLC